MTSLSRGAFFPEKSFSTPEARFYGFMSVSFAKLGKVNDFFGEKYKFVGKKYKNINWKKYKKLAFSCLILDFIPQIFKNIKTIHPCPQVLQLGEEKIRMQWRLSSFPSKLKLQLFRYKIFLNKFEKKRKNWNLYLI